MSKPFITKDIAYNKKLRLATNQFPKGVFLTVAKQDKVNTMTIGWGMIGVMWGKPMFAVGVRPSRYSYSFLDLGSEFTVSIPLTQKLKKELSFCGSHSGRSMNKIEALDIHYQPAKQVQAPVIAECELHYECRVVAKNQLFGEGIEESIINRSYQQNDFHTIFYGEIVSCYKIVEE